jgi:hypothetical protein
MPFRMASTGKLGAPRPHQPGEAKDLAGAHVDADILQQGGVGIGGVAVARDPLHLHHDRAGRAMTAEPGEELGARPPHHHLHKIVDLQFAHVAATDLLAVTQDRDPVADLLHLMQAMSDIDDGEAACFQVGDNAE